MSYLGALSIRDGANLDAFSRLRASSPGFVFDAQFTYNLLPFRVEMVTSGTGATIAHDPTNRCAKLDFAATPNGGTAYAQTYEFFRYQPGRSQLIFAGFNFRAKVASVTKFVGYSDGINGVEFFVVGTGSLSFRILSATTAGNQVVAQASWNLDKLDGTGASGHNLDISKNQLLVIDMQAAGRIRVGFNIDGVIVYAHEFRAANRSANPFLQYSSLPLRGGMTTTATATATMDLLHAAVMSEGGSAEPYGLPRTAKATVVVGNGVATHAISLRPTTTFEGLVNRNTLALHSLDVLVTGNAPVEVTVAVGQALTGTTTFVAPAASAFEINTAGTLSGTPALGVETSYVPATNSAKGAVQRNLLQRIPITLNAAGAQRLNGTLTVILKGIGGASAAEVALNWLELR